MLFVSLIAPVTNYSFFFFNDTATTEIYTLSLHDALPICTARATAPSGASESAYEPARGRPSGSSDRKSTRLNSSHSQISYAVFCLKKKKKPPAQGHPSACQRLLYGEASTVAERA